MILRDYKGWRDLLQVVQGRSVDADRTVDVYRNLRRGGYSVRQGRHVVAHAEAVMLVDVELVVSRAGWRRSWVLGKKTVHAFARGRLTDSGMGTCAEEASRLPRIRYDLRRGAFVWDPYPHRALRGASVVALNSCGAHAAYFTR